MTIHSTRQNNDPGRIGFANQYPNEDWQRHDSGNGAGLTQLLGWFSIGLGLAEVAAPHTVAQWIGIPDSDSNQSVLRAVGLREIASGIGILTQSQPATWVKARVGGDVMDLALLGTALNSHRADQSRVVTAMMAVAGVAALDLLCSQQLSHQASPAQQPDWQQPTWQQPERQPLERSPGAPVPSVRHERGIHIKKVITVNRSADEIYQFWRNFENLPRFMNHLETVEVTDEQHSHWRAKAPAGLTVGWDAEIIDDTPGERISWRSLEGSGISNAGSVRFKPATGGRGTVVTVEIHYDPPGGAIGAAIAKLFGEEPGQQVQEDLRIFKQVMETGEVVRSDSSLRGASSAQRPAQPAKPKKLDKVLERADE